MVPDSVVGRGTGYRKPPSLGSSVGAPGQADRPLLTRLMEIDRGKMHFPEERSRGAELVWHRGLPRKIPLDQ